MATKYAGTRSTGKRHRSWNRFESPSCFEALEPRQLMAGDPYGNTPAQAYAVTGLTATPTVITDSVNSVDSKDFFKITLGSTQLFNASLTGLSANANLRLYSKTGELLSSSLASGTANENIQVKLAADDYYLLVCREVGDTNYSLSLSATNATVDGAGNTKAQAKDIGTIAGGGSFNVTDFVGTSDTNDYYKFTINMLCSVTLNLSDLHGDADLQLLDASGTVIGSSSHSGTTTESFTQSLRAGTYYVRVYRYAGDTTYTLAGLTSAITDNAGNTTATALDIGKLSANATINKDTLDSFDADDFYTFSVGSYSQVTLVLKDLSADATLKLMDSSGNVLDTSAISGNAEERIFIKLNKGNYFIRVSLNTGSTNYTLRSLAESLTGESQGNTTDGTVETVAAGDYDELHIYGTAGNDTIIVTQNDNTLNVTINGNEHEIFVVSGGTDITAIAIWGGDGDDTITITNSVSINARLYGQGGSDKLRNQTSGYGTIVSIGGGIDILSGGMNTSFWFDAGDIATTTQADLAADRIHKVNAFYQPYATTSTSDPNYVPLELNGQNLNDPYAITDYNSVTATVNISDQSLWGDNPSVDDINQNQLGDCYYLATIGGLAYTNPAKLKELVVDLGDGTYAVAYNRGGVHAYVRVDGDVVGTDISNLRFSYPNDGGPIWAAIMEKAYAYFRYGSNTYASIEGGWPYDVLNDFGVGNQHLNPAGGTSQAEIYQRIQSSLTANKAVMLCTYSQESFSSSIPLVGGHAYTVISASIDTEGNYIYVVRNPWGVDGDQDIASDGSYPYDGYVTITGSQMKQACDDLCWIV